VKSLWLWLCKIPELNDDSDDEAMLAYLCVSTSRRRPGKGWNTEWLICKIHQLLQPASKVSSSS